MRTTKGERLKRLRRACTKDLFTAFVWPGEYLSSNLLRYRETYVRLKNVGFLPLSPWFVFGLL